MITLTYGATVMELPTDLRWTDEFEWNAVKQNVENTITGAIIVESAAILKGMPITLAPVDESSAWISRINLRTLKTWSDIAGAQFVLVLDGVTRNVIFRHQDGGGVTASPIVHYSSGTSDGDFFSASFKFMEV